MNCVQRGPPPQGCNILDLGYLCKVQHVGTARQFLASARRTTEKTSAFIRGYWCGKKGRARFYIPKIRAVEKRFPPVDPVTPPRFAFGKRFLTAYSRFFPG